jgi:hypothetical protein
MMNVRGFGVAAVFLVGCAVGGVSSQLVVPRASAQQAATLPKWEYYCGLRPSFDGPAAATEANKLGAESWELASALDHGGWCFKRPKR